MINKEEREAMERLKKHLDIVNWFMGDDNSIKRDIITILNLIDKQETRIKELEEINTEHQKLNGDLQKKYSKLENHYNCRLKDIEMLNAHIEKLNRQNEKLQGIIDGKVVQEMGMSDLYKED